MTPAVDPHAAPQALDDSIVDLDAPTTDVGFCWALAGCSAAPCDLAVEPCSRPATRAAAHQRGAEARDRKGRGRAEPLAPVRTKTMAKKTTKKLAPKPRAKTKPATKAKRRAENWGSLRVTAKMLEDDARASRAHLPPLARARDLLITLRLACDTTMQRLFPRGRDAQERTRATSLFIESVCAMTEAITREVRRAEVEVESGAVVNRAAEHGGGPVMAPWGRA